MRIVIVQRWEESEKGWGTRPDGYSLHLTLADEKEFVERYWLSLPTTVPDIYSRPSGEPYEALVSNDDFALMMDSKDGRRLHGIAPAPLGEGDKNA